MASVKIDIELVESLIDGGAEYTGSVLILELKDLMESSISCGLVNGLEVSIRLAFEEAWRELVVEEDPIDIEI